MAEERRFARFNRGADAQSIHEIPSGGFCLSAFLVVSPDGEPSRVLLGRIDPKADWGSIGGLDAARVEAHRHGWMLPSSQLLYGEGPDAAARRILHEQLRDLPVRLGEPRVYSEVYVPRRFPDAKDHWDLMFVYLGLTRAPPTPPLAPWERLEFVDVGRAKASEFSRSHEDVLALAGRTVGSEGATGPD